MPYNERIMSHVNYPRGAGRLESATHSGTAGEPGEGPYIRIHLRIEDEQILESSYESNGCPASIASASVLCMVVACKPVSAAEMITARDIDVLLGGLPEGKGDKADLALRALRSAIQSGSATPQDRDAVSGGS